MTELDPRCCGGGNCIINAEGECWCGQKWDGTKMCMPELNLKVKDDKKTKSQIGSLDIGQSLSVLPDGASQHGRLSTT
jgi:hypothetical protein